jgi:hypothetical protein
MACQDIIENKGVVFACQNVIEKKGSYCESEFQRKDEVEDVR